MVKYVSDVSDVINLVILNVSHNSPSLRNPEQSFFVTAVLKSPIMIRLSKLSTTVLK